MKNISFKLAFLGIITSLTFGTFTSSCSKDDNGYEEPAKGTIDPAVGTYKGKLNVYNPLPNTTQDTWYDAVFIVTKQGPDKLTITAKTGEAYSAVTSKTFTVETGAFFGSNTADIVSLTGSVEGIFHFYGSNKNISISTSKQAQSDIVYIFDGAKQ